VVLGEIPLIIWRRRVVTVIQRRRRRRIPRTAGGGERLVQGASFDALSVEENAACCHPNRILLLLCPLISICSDVASLLLWCSDPLRGAAHSRRTFSARKDMRLPRDSGCWLLGRRRGIGTSRGLRRTAALFTITATVFASSRLLLLRRLHSRSSSSLVQHQLMRRLVSVINPTVTSTTTTTSTGAARQSVPPQHYLGPFFASAFAFQNKPAVSWSAAGTSRALATTAMMMSTSTSSSTTTKKTIQNEKSLKEILETSLQNSWVRQLSQETPENLRRSLEAERLSPSDSNYNQTKRPVYNGHYVLVKPKPLNEPRLVLYSKDLCSQLGLSPEVVESSDFVNWVSGNSRSLGGVAAQETWATPYALSIMGTRYTSNCPYGTGDGYGDGRAISIGELNDTELQLKGAGQTPFCRTADGRAVLRSSIREFLGSEAMHHLGVSSTRALSLVVSDRDKVQRPWYREGSQLRIPSIDDPRLASYPEEQRVHIIRQLRQNQKDDPNILIEENCAITCRVAPSFTRIGHYDLFARRAEISSVVNADGTSSRWDTTTLEWKELEQMVWHGCYREFRDEAYVPFVESDDIVSAATKLLELSADKISDMVAGWIRVGFAQGNFNGDNCLIAGRTMDYGTLARCAREEINERRIPLFVHD